MNLWRRYKRLTLWNKVAVLGAAASLIALPLTLVPIFVSDHKDTISERQDTHALSRQDSLAIGVSKPLRTIPKPIELSELLMFFLSRSRTGLCNSDFHPRSHGTLGEISVVWNSCYDKEVPQEMDPRILTCGEACVAVDGVAWIDEDEQPAVLWNVWLMAVPTPQSEFESEEPEIIVGPARDPSPMSNGAPIGYDEIVLSSPRCRELDETYIEESFHQAHFSVVMHRCRDDVSEDEVTLYVLERAGFCPASLIVASTDGSQGMQYTFYLYPFRAVTCDKLVFDGESREPYWLSGWLRRSPLRVVTSSSTRKAP